MSPRSTFATITALYQQNQFSDALTLAEATLLHRPDEGRLWELLGLIYRALREEGPARHALETASLHVPLGPVARCALADCYAHAGPLPLAYEMYRDLAASPETPLPLLLPIAAGLAWIGASRLALQVAREAVRRNPDDPRGWHQLEQCLSDCGFPLRLVLAAARKAVDLAPDEPRYRHRLVTLLHRSGRLTEAVRVISRCDAASTAGLCCPDALARIATVALAAGNRPLAAACRARRDQVVAARSENRSRGQAVGQSKSSPVAQEVP